MKIDFLNRKVKNKSNISGKYNSFRTFDSLEAVYMEGTLIEKHPIHL